MSDLNVLINEHTAMVNRLAKGGDKILAQTSADDMHIMHMMIGMSGETGELAEAILNDDKENMVEEFGDYEFYFRGACDKAGLNPENRRSPYSASSLPSKEQTFMLFDVEHSFFVDVFKKRFVYNKDVTPVTLENAAQNLRDALDALYAVTGVTYREALEHNMHKLEKGAKARYKNGYSDEAAQQRADKQ